MLSCSAVARVLPHAMALMRSQSCLEKELTGFGELFLLSELRGDRCGGDDESATLVARGTVIVSMPGSSAPRCGWLWRSSSYLNWRI